MLMVKHLRNTWNTLPKFNRHSPWKMMVGILLSYWTGNFSGAMLNFGRVGGLFDFTIFYTNSLGSFQTIWLDCQIGQRQTCCFCCFNLLWICLCLYPTHCIHTFARDFLVSDVLRSSQICVPMYPLNNFWPLVEAETRYFAPGTVWAAQQILSLWAFHEQRWRSQFSIKSDLQGFSTAWELRYKRARYVKLPKK